MERKCNNIINIFNQTRWQTKCVNLCHWKDTRYLSQYCLEFMTHGFITRNLMKRNC